MANELISFEFPLKGRLITSQDPSVIGDNFRSLKNLKYKEVYPEGVGGMTPINSTALSNQRMRNAFHYTKDNPDETHLLIHAFDTNLINGKIYDHTTVIPSSGGFGSSALFTCTDTTTERKGFFSSTPQSGIAFCDGKDNLIWSGNEMAIGSFINYDPAGPFYKDYTEIVQNTLTDANNVATLTRVAPGADVDTELLLHFDNNVNDSSTVGNIVTNTGMTFVTTPKVFGTHAIRGSTAAGAQYLTIPDAANFDFSGGIFTLDFRFKIDSLSKKRGIYWQKTGASSTYNFRLQCTTGGSLNLRIKDDGSTVLNLATTANTIVANTWYHGAIVESSSNFYIFVNGNLAANISSTVRAANYTGRVAIGAASTAGSTSIYSGYLDEFRVSSVARWTDSFQLPLSAYATKYQTHYYLGARRPIKGFKPYIIAGNSSSANMSVYEWQGSGWAAVGNLVDGTSCGGRSMAKTGTITFTTTVATAKPMAINNVVLYWYKIQVEGADDNITVSNLNNNAPIQSIKDLWNGSERIIASCYKHTNSYQNYITSVFQDYYDSNSSATFMNISSLTSVQYIVCGFLEQMMGIFIKLAPDYENTSANTILTLQYSSDGITWTEVSGLIDGTSISGISLAKSGLITWNPPTAKINEFKRAISTDEPFWYYKFIWSQTLDATVRIYYIAGISAPKTIQGYAISMIAKNRLWLLKNNTVICSAKGLTEVWNGEDSTEFTFGDEKELVGGISLYSIIGSNIYEIALFFKRNNLFGISGNTPDDFIQYEITLLDGLAASKTLKRGISLIGSTPTPVIIWQGAKGIYMFDNKTPVPIHGDIDNFFNPNESSNTRKLHASYIENSAAFIDEENMEYHWLFADASSTGALNREYVFNLKSGKWYEIDRGIGKYLQAGFSVTDINSNKYFYGLTNTGIMERLEYGTNFDGNAIAHEIWTGDIAPFKGKVMEETVLRKLKMISLSTTSIANNMLVKHYVDGATNASSSFTMSPMRTGYRITKAKHSLKGNPVGTFHSIRINISTTNQTVGFTPIYLGGHYETVREDL